jgi:hypothetical protein
LPVSGDSIKIDAGRRVLLDVATPPLKALLVEGELVADPQRDVAITSDYVIVRGSRARLQIGSAQQPHLKRATITLTGPASEENALNLNMGTKVLGAMDGGRIDLAGEPRRGWTRLGTTAAAGANSVTLAEAMPWRAGDRIVVTSSGFVASQSEARTITAVSGVTLTLDAPLTHEHLCKTTAVAGQDLRQCVEVGLLSRNVVVQGDGADAFGAHVMIMGSGQAIVSGTEFQRCGQTGRLGRYCFHWHLLGDATGQSIADSSIHSAFHKGVVIHGTDKTLVKGNVVYNTLGHNIIWSEDGFEQGNVLEDNLAALARPIPAAQRLDNVADDLPSNFWGRSPGNILRRNVAAGADGGQGFWFDGGVNDGRPSGAFASCAACLSTAGRIFGVNEANPTDPRNQQPFGEFKDNVAHSSNRPRQGQGGDRDFAGGSGLFVSEYNPEVAGKVAVFEGFTAYWNNLGAWVDSSYAGHTMRTPWYDVELRGARLAENATNIRSNGGLVRDSLVVGLAAKAAVESVNLDYNPNVRGLEWHHFPADYENVTFANFRPFSYRGRQVRAGVIGMDSNEDTTSWVVKMAGVRVINSDLTVIQDHYTGPAGTALRTVAIENTDGSLFGSGRAEGLVSNNGTLKTLDCSAVGELMRCPNGAPRYVPIQLGSTAGVDYGQMTFTRLSDGISHRLKSFGAGGWNGIGTVLGNATYRVDMNGPVRTLHVSIGMGVEGGRGQWVGLALPFAGASPVVALSDPGGGLSADAQITRFADLAQFNASTAQGWYLDRSARLLYVRARRSLNVCDATC